MKPFFKFLIGEFNVDHHHEFSRESIVLTHFIINISSYWLAAGELTVKAFLELTSDETLRLLKEANELLRILSSIVLNTKQRM